MQNDKMQQRKLLIERTRTFAKRVRVFCAELPVSIANSADTKQLIRSSGSIGANYLEACEAFSKRDCIARIRISRKEAKETLHWLYLLDAGSKTAIEEEQRFLLKEADELLAIFSSIILKLTVKSS